MTPIHQTVNFLKLSRRTPPESIFMQRISVIATGTIRECREHSVSEWISSYCSICWPRSRWLSAFGAGDVSIWSAAADPGWKPEIPDRVIYTMVHAITQSISKCNSEGQGRVLYKQDRLVSGMCVLHWRTRLIQPRQFRIKPHKTTSKLSKTNHESVAHKTQCTRALDPARLATHFLFWCLLIQRH